VDRAALTASYLREISQRGLRASDLMGDLPDLLKSRFGGRYLSRPLFIGTEWRQLCADVQNVRDAVTSLPDRLFGGNFAEFASAAGAYGAVAAALTVQSKPPTLLGRADLYAEESGFKLLELNLGSAVGGTGHAEMGRRLLRHPVLAEFARSHGLGCGSPRRNIAETMLAETGLEPGSSAVVALAGWPTGYEQIFEDYLKEMAAEWRQLGIDAHGCHLGQLSCRQGRVWLGSRPVDAIFRMFTLGNLHESARPPAMLAPILDAASRGEVRLCTPLDSDVCSSKATLAMLSDDANRPLFTPAERDSIDRIVPWTRMVQPGPVTTPDGSRAELFDYAMAHQNELLLKPSMGLEGMGVIPGWESPSPERWREQVMSAAAPWYVIQERIRPESELFPDENGELIPWVPVWGLFTSKLGYGGIYARGTPGSEAGVVNHARGACSGTCLSAGLPAEPPDDQASGAPRNREGAVAVAPCEREDAASS
jgi:hypothetical protein